MTDSRPTPAPDGHLDDEATLDALDGALAPDRRAHLEACATCRAEVAAHAAVRDALAVPPPAVDPAAREAALAAALDAWAPAPGAEAPATTATAVPAASAASADELGARWRRRRPVPSSGWLGAAAVVLLLVVALPLLALVGGGRDDSDMSTASGGGADSSASDATEESATGLAESAPAPVDVGDLGAIAPGEDLRPVVDRALGRADADDEVATLDAPEAGAGPADGSAPVEAAAGGPCVEDVREAMPDLGTLVLVGAATVEGEPARVLGFEAPTPSRPAVVVVVVAEPGCEVVTFQSHAQG